MIWGNKSEKSCLFLTVYCDFSLPIRPVILESGVNILSVYWEETMKGLNVALRPEKRHINEILANITDDI